MSAPDQRDDVEGFVTLHVPSRYNYLRIVRQSVTDLCARTGLSEIDSAQLEMAVDESCANIIEHSYEGEEDAGSAAQGLGLKINFIQYSDRIVVEIYDYGHGFDFDSYQYPEPAEYVESSRRRGLGMYIINKFVDELSYQRGTSLGNCLKLTRYI